MNTNYTMRGGFFDAGFGHLPAYLNIKMYKFGMYSHGLDPRSCEINDLSVINNVSLYGWSNGQSITNATHLRKQYSLCAGCSAGCWPGATEGTNLNAYFDTLLINGIDSFVGPGQFFRAFCSPCTSVWDSVPKYLPAPDPNPVVLFSTGAWYVDSTGIQTSCIGPLNFRKSFQNKNSEIQILPNPAETHLKVENISVNSTITIYNLLGDAILTINSNSFSIDINIEKFRPGIYFIHISNGECKKFIKL